MKGKMFRLGLMWLPAVALMALIFWSSSQPNLSTQPGGFSDLIVKKGAHMIGYGLLFLCFLRGLGKISTRALIIAMVLTACYAISDEYHQLWVQGRNGKVLDVVIDLCGAVLALTIFIRNQDLKKIVFWGLNQSVLGLGA